MHKIEILADHMYHKPIDSLTSRELYEVLLHYVKEEAASRPLNSSKKKLYYLSAEFLIGKLLSTNLINLGSYDEVKDLLAEHGQSLNDVEDAEQEPSLGNGGLGRLAACFLDSIASLGITGDGVGLNYHFGLFRQTLDHNEQGTLPDEWLDADTWLEKEEGKSYEVPFAKFTLHSTLYNIDVLGFEKETRNRLRLFDLDSVSSDIIEEGSIQFDKTNVEKNLTLFLYPDDSDRNGNLLRIYQQYFMVSNAAQLIIDEALEKGSNLHDLADFATIQINDTHPTFVIPELIRLLTTRYDFSFEEAVAIARKTVAFTNHTILAEALEKWPMSDIEEVIPDIAAIIRQLDQLVRQEFPGNQKVTVIDDQNRAHMAHIAMHFGYSINGVAKLHTQILKETELNDFYQIYPEKFNNKTNGISFRRWIMSCNPSLARLFDQLIGSSWRHDEDLTGLEKYIYSENVHQNLEHIKEANKEALNVFLDHNQGVTFNPNSIVDVQIKRFHEYKRQQMLALYIIYKYHAIKNGDIPKRPITIIFGGKAAPAYIIAQDIIHLIMTLSDRIKNDPDVSPYLQVIMVKNYNVTTAEHLIPAADISEQIPLASKEASGTGNMKFMLNGALTLGTMDGANVEIAERVGQDNIYTFGRSSEGIVNLYATHGYHPQDYYNRPAIKALVDDIVSEDILKLGNPERLNRLYNDIKGKDWFMAMIDIEEFIQTKEKVYQDYEDRKSWLAKVVKNIAQAGYFSSDRTISDYNQDIWHLEEH